MAGPIPLHHWTVFDSLGESQVRMQFEDASGDVGVQAREWLTLKELERSAASAAKRDAREEETLSIAREANRIASSASSSARRANKIAATAAMLATAATIIATVIGVMYAKP